MLQSKFATKDIKQGLARLAHAPGAHTKIPGLAAVRISGDIEGIWMQRNTEVARVRVRVDAEVEDEGETRVNHQHLSDVIGSYVAPSVSLIDGGEFISLQAGKSKAKIQTIKEELLQADFSPAGEFVEFSMSLEWLVDALKTVQHAVTRGGTDTLVNVLIRTDTDDDGRLYVIASDRKQFMACATDSPECDVDVMLSLDAANAVMRIFDGLEGDALIEVYETGLSIKHPDAEAFLAVPAGKYPNVFPVIEQRLEEDDVASAECNRERLIEAIKVASVFQDAESSAVTVRFYKDEVQVAGVSPQGETVDSLEAEVVEGDAMRINCKFLSQTLAALKCPTVTIRRKKECVTMEDEDRFAFVALINPPNKAEEVATK